MVFGKHFMRLLAFLTKGRLQTKKGGVVVLLQSVLPKIIINKHGSFTSHDNTIYRHSVVAIQTVAALRQSCNTTSAELDYINEPRQTQITAPLVSATPIPLNGIIF